MVGSDDKVSDRYLVKDSVGPVFRCYSRKLLRLLRQWFHSLEHRARAQEKQVIKNDEDDDITDITELE